MRDGLGGRGDENNDLKRTFLLSLAIAIVAILVHLMCRCCVNDAPIRSCSFRYPFHSSALSVCTLINIVCRVAFQFIFISIQHHHVIQANILRSLFSFRCPPMKGKFHFSSHAHTKNYHPLLLLRPNFLVPIEIPQKR